MMVVDTSAIVAVLLGEPDADQFSEILAETRGVVISAVTLVELSFVIESKKREAGRADLENYLREARLDVIPVSVRHAEIAIEAFRRFGRGRDRAALNIGDCFSYALSKALGEPLLFKGNDFIHTDIRPALAP